MPTPSLTHLSLDSVALPSGGRANPAFDRSVVHAAIRTRAWLPVQLLITPDYLETSDLQSFGNFPYQVLLWEELSATDGHWYPAIPGQRFDPDTFAVKLSKWEGGYRWCLIYSKLAPWDASIIICAYKILNHI